MMELVRWQVALGPRFPGSQAHRSLRAELADRLERHAQRVVRHEFLVSLPGGPAACTNLIGRFPARQHGVAARQDARSGASLLRRSLLLGSHFDTRLRADREPDPALRRQPIPGANDGGSGTAILLYLLPFLAEGRLERDVTVVFFDAEDVGEIAGNPFSLGAARFVRDAPVPLPEEAVILDMVGGRDLSLDLDAHILHHPASLALTRRVFEIGRAVGGPVFGAWEAEERREGEGRPAGSASGDSGACGSSGGVIKRREKLRYIISDQYPFMAAGIASCLLIDLDYPQWHTQADLPEAMAPASLATIAEVLRRFLLPQPP